MNRRSFLSKMIKAAAGAMILPSAVTYNRTWKPVSLASGIRFYQPRRLNFWYQTSLSVHCCTDEYLKALNAALQTIRKGEAEAWSHFKELPLARPSLKDQLIAAVDESKFQRMIDSGEYWL